MGMRMKSALPKVLHKIAGRSMLGHALHAAKALNAVKAVIIHGPGMAVVQHEASGVF